MKRIIVTLRPRNDFIIVRRVRIDTDHHLRPDSVAVIPGCVVFAYAPRRYVNRIQMHRGMHRGQGIAKTKVLSNCVIIYFVNEISAPIPLQTRRVERVEHGLQCWLRQRTHKIECRLLESTDRLECFFGFRGWACIRPYDAAHFFHVKMFGERRRRRYREKRKKATQIIRSSGNQIAIPLHHVCCFAQLVEHWTAINRINRMQSECKRSDYPKISTATTNSPEQIRVFIGIRFHKCPVRQYDIGREEIIDGESALAREVPDASAKGQSTNSGGRNDSARSGG